MLNSNIADYVSQYVELQQRGNELWGLSCFKEENTPSLSINPETQVWKDFSSGKGGNILSFIMEYHKCDFTESLKILKDFLKIVDDTEYIRPAEIVRILNIYKPKIKNDKKDFIRKIMPNDVMEKYDKKRILSWENEGILTNIIDKWQVRFDSERDTIIFPIWDLYGNVINIKARDTTGLSLSKYFYYYKLGKLDFFYGYHQHYDTIKSQKEVLIFEGEKSLMKLESWEIKNSLSLCNGSLTDDQLHILINLGVNVVFCLDKDKSPRKDENIKKLCRFCKVQYVVDTKDKLGEKDSPCDCGVDIWDELYKKRIILK